ncbi:MAG: patatin-like phospholipase family protein [Chitinophagales bacterium]|nr:patatin-like phospholipase family protein [Chitinophagales bacterium]
MKILSIDGGGIRGIIPAMILEEIEARTGKPISHMFDLIAGTSTGGILALGLTVDNGRGQPKYSASDLVKLYREKGQQIFDRDTWHRIRSMGNLRDEKYPNENLKKLLKEYFGNARLKDCLTEVIITSYETERRIPWIFKSIHAKNPKKENYDFDLVDIALATSAAPTYFEPHKVEYKENDYLSFIDGGIYANNPAMCAYAEAKSMFKKKDDEIRIVSLGTGQLTRRLYHKDLKNLGLIGWAQPILSCAFDGISDTVDYQLSKFLSRENYFRFQAELKEGNDDMDDSTNTNLRVLQLLAEDIIHKNKSEIKKMVNKICL